MNGNIILVSTVSIIGIYVLSFACYIAFSYPDNSEATIKQQVTIKDKLDSCKAYLSSSSSEGDKSLRSILESSLTAAYSVDKSRIRSKNNANYAMYANRIVWGGTIGAPLFIILLFALTSTTNKDQRNKSITIIIAFLAVLNFIDSAYNTKARWGFSRISQYHKESLVDQWLYRINVACLNKKGINLKDFIYDETDSLLEKFANHRNSVTPGFLSGDFNKIPDPTELLPSVDN